MWRAIKYRLGLLAPLEETNWRQRLRVSTRDQSVPQICHANRSLGFAARCLSSLHCSLLAQPRIAMKIRMVFVGAFCEDYNLRCHCSGSGKDVAIVSPDEWSERFHLSFFENLHSFKWRKFSESSSFLIFRIFICCSSRNENKKGINHTMDHLHDHRVPSGDHLLLCLTSLV